ncbi:MAG TPA: hypothetical protein VMV94_05660 [Phycisphaerae bacterium]|nr:hypothetical protein [Phycisphaerae bacterium]
MTEPAPSRCLLAVDLGLTTGLALFSGDGRLQWYRSQHFADPPALRRAVHRLLGQIPDLAIICVEGGGPICAIWEKEAARRGIPLKRIAAETWRKRLLYARDQRSGRQAKRKAEELARQVIEWSQAARPTSLRHDASDAILIGLWGVLDAGWLAAPPT